MVSIIIVTRGLSDYIYGCLDSVTGQGYRDVEIIVIDNSENEESSRNNRRAGLNLPYGKLAEPELLLKERFPQIKLYSAPGNLYYCAALNKGIGMSKGEFVLCLNDDVILEKDFLSQALKAFEIDRKIGMVSAKILRRDGKIIDSAGLFLSIWRSPSERGYGLHDTGQFEQEGYIFGVNGAAAFYRKAMLEDIKLGDEYFDPNFRIFYEDLDISWRAQRLGWKCYYNPKAIAYHIRGGTVRQQGINKRYARHYLDDSLHTDLVKNRYLTLLKNETWFGFLLHLPFILIYDAMVWGYLLVFKPRLLLKILSTPIPFKSALRKRQRILGRAGLNPPYHCV